MLAAIHIQLIVGTIFIILYSVTILGLVLVIITENRNPLKTIPWVIVLLLAPGIGLLFYFFFGQDNRKQRIISRRTYKRIFTHDMHHCERLIPSRWLKRPLKQRMAESFMRLFSPLL